MNSPIRRTRPDKTGIHAPLGDLEQAVMRCVWDSQEHGILGSEIQEKVGLTHPIALTTALTTLERLRDKGFVSRDREGKAFRYRPSVTEEELQRRIVGGVLDRLIAQFPSAVAAYFAQQSGSVASRGQCDGLADLADRVERLQEGQG